MADDKLPMQADGSGNRKGEGRLASRKGAGESEGGAYPNPHTGGGGENQDTFTGHGGQSDIAYHGADQLGAKPTGKKRNAQAGDQALSEHSGLIN